MELKTYFAQDASGNIMPGAAVTVYLANTMTLATGLEDENGSPLSNPFNADSDAKVAFYAPDGLYDINVVSGVRSVVLRAQFSDVYPAFASTDPGKGASLVGFKQDGAGAVPRTVDDKQREIISVEDFGATAGGTNAGAFADAVAAAGSRNILVPFAGDETAFPADYSNTMFMYDGLTPVRTTHAGPNIDVAKKAFKAQFPTPHGGTKHSAFQIEAQAKGSGTNGPASADYALSLAIHKKGYAEATDPIAGEINGLTITVRQDGPKGTTAGAANSSDGGGILVNVQNVEDAGFSCILEGVTSNYNRTSQTVVRSIGTQIGALDQNQVGTPSYGYATISTNGNNTHGLYVGAQGTATWTNILYSPNALTIPANGDYIAVTTNWPNGAWSIKRNTGVNGETIFNHRGTGAMYFNAQDASAIQFAVNGSMRWQIDSAGGMKPGATLSADLGGLTRRISSIYTNQIDLGSTTSAGAKIIPGTGSPEGVVTAGVGSLFLRTDGGAGTTLYVKQSGTGNTGWVAK